MSYTETIMEYVYDQYSNIHEYDMESALDWLEDEMDFTREDIREMIECNIEYGREIG
tara:strand:- start:192 stop:362 length:171 start_codon:yes stop_codon:yes gene_type:complete